uniref:RING-type E3 ubiquitin transferase n=1 Tax=Musa acuminata subsp. malaccensis TaxID=214687 RepID=A0A804HUE4_MUSAM|nr:PREDICTED: E3 ubiquitin-protein ligase SPL2-like isoform X2 [Musa acuminata subsp. malaccensis]
MPLRNHGTAAVLARLAVACDGAILGLALAAVSAASWVKYATTSAALDRISCAPSAPISGLRAILSSADYLNEDPLLVVVRGRVQPSSAVEALSDGAVSETNGVLTPRGSDEMAVAILNTQMCLYNEWRGMFRWNFDLHALFAKSLKEQRSSSSLLKSVSFVLVEAGDWPNSGYVHVNLDGSAHPLPLTTVYHELHPIQVPPFTFFQVFFGSGYPVALLDEEKILPVGKEITAIGICRPRDEAIEIKSCQELPCFLNWWKWKEWRLRRRRQNEDLNNEALSRSSMEQEDVPDGELCVICLSRRRRTAFVPCGHLVCCPHCATSVVHDSSPKCPLCCQDVRSSIRIYES